MDSPSPSPPPQQPQNLQQFLSQVLSQRGPSSLPYLENTKWLIRQHLVMLINEYPSLTPKTSTFTHNHGTTANVLQVEGTIPMVYGGVTYNVPISVWLIESYPRHPPDVYVNPTRDMVIKRPHPHVNPSGLVSVPYLHNWIHPSSNLVDLVRNLSGLFGKNPPLYSRGPQSRPSNTNTHNPNRPLSSSASMGSLGSMNSPRVHPQNPPPIRDDPGQVYRKNAIIKLVENLHGDVEVLRKKREGEMEGLFSLQGVLREREEQLQKGLREMLDEKEGLEQQLQMVLMNSDVLEVWLRENEGKTKDKSENVEVFEPADALSKQMLESNALDLAIEDVIYSLDKAVQEGAIGLDQYLKNVRSLSRDQFFHRATSTKVGAVQMQAQVASMATRAPQYAM